MDLPLLKANSRCPRGGKRLWQDGDESCSYFSIFSFKRSELVNKQGHLVLLLIRGFRFNSGRETSAMRSKTQMSPWMSPWPRGHRSKRCGTLGLRHPARAQRHILSAGIPVETWNAAARAASSCSTSAINRHQLEAANQSAGFLARSLLSAACRERVARNSASGAIWPP